MRIFFSALLVLFSIPVHAFDCSAVKSFAPKGSQAVVVTVSKFSWNGFESQEEQICQSSFHLNWYDVRRREEEAYYCLKPDPIEVLTCKSVFNGEEAEIYVVPASWVRSWKPRPVREYRFHAYIVKAKTPDSYLDIFARSLQENLKSKNVVVEGSAKTGPVNPEDGFWVRVEFQK